MTSRAAVLGFRAASGAASTFALVWAAFAPSRVRSTPRSFVILRPMTPPVVAETTSDALLTRALERDPFGADSVTATASVTTAPVEEPSLPRVLGTVVDSAGGSFALCQLGTRQAVILRSGQRIGDYVVRRVEKGRVVFAGLDGGNIELHVPRTGE